MKKPRPKHTKAKAKVRQGKVLVVTSGKGGVGKTTSTAALGAALAKSGQKVVLVDFDVGLRNLDLGLWQGKLIDEVKQKQPKIYRRWQEHPETVCPPEGEMIADAMQRVRGAIDKLLRKLRSGTVVLVVSEPLARLVRCHITGEQLGDLWQAECACGSWESLTIEAENLVAG